MTQTEQLIASLAALDSTSLYLNDTDYLDWSSRDDDSGAVLLEVGDGDQAVQVAMTREDMLSLQQRLTAWLLANPA